MHAASVHPIRTTHSPAELPAEQPMLHAPSVTLANGYCFVPQHYLSYQQTEVSVRALVADIDFDDSTPVFVATDANGLYVQVGMIGRENYDRASHVRPRKLVYGRRWRIDADTPSSEIIQTVMLAIKKAREHEVRELLTVCEIATGKTSAVFSNHHDLPLMAANHKLLATRTDNVCHSPADVELLLDRLRFAERKLELLAAEQRNNGSWLLDLRVAQPSFARWLENDLPEFDRLTFTLLLPSLSKTQLLYQIMDALISHSDRHVEENFRYRGFARFSRANDPDAIAELSIASRPYARDAGDSRFMQVFRAANYEVDASRAPGFGEGVLGEKNRRIIGAFPALQGHMPTSG